MRLASGAGMEAAAQVIDTLPPSQGAGAPAMLDAALALCRQADPAPGGEEARRLGDLLLALAQAAGPNAGAHLADSLQDERWVTPDLHRRLAQGRPSAAPPSRAPYPSHLSDERRLVAKLAAAGQLRPGFLVRALREGRTEAFYAAVAALSGLEVDEVASSIVAAPEHLACALRAVGIDRSVYPSVLALLRGLEHGRPHPRTGEDAAVAAVFALSPAAAAACLRAAGAPA